jgi:hypothetical protein
LDVFSFTASASLAFTCDIIDLLCINCLGSVGASRTGQKRWGQKASDARLGAMWLQPHGRTPCSDETPVRSRAQAKHSSLFALWEVAKVDLKAEREAAGDILQWV